MSARRRAGPAALAAALLGAGLALYRPPSVPELRAGPRAPRPSPGSPAAPAVPGALRAPGSGGEAGEPGREGPGDEELALWRDALADRPFGTLAREPAPAARSFTARNGARLGAAPAGGGENPGRSGRAEREKGNPSAAPQPPPPAAMRGSARTREAAPRARTPLASGPASDEEDPAEEESVPAAAPGAPGEAARASRLSFRLRRGARAFPLFQPPRRAGRGPRSAAARKVRPLLLSSALGRGALRPPPASIVPPDLTGLAARRPLRLADGSPTPSQPYGLERLEALDPRRAGAPCRRRARHWDEGGPWHDGQARGLAADARWLWLWKDETRWWALRAPNEPPLLSHHGLWWSKRRGVWFALHGGELWSWRRFAAWDAEGLLRLADGVELVYSADFAKVAVITPGAGAVLYDARTGAELGEWEEDELPRRRPRAPSGLRLPRGI